MDTNITGKRSRFRKFLRKFHIYGGLYCSFYLILMGYTGFTYNHPQAFKPAEQVTEWGKPVRVPSGADNNTIIDTINQQTGIFGHRPPWRQWEDKQGNFHFFIGRPGKIYEIRLNSTNDSIFVKQTYHGFTHLLMGMHPSSTGMPEHPLLKLWRFYAESSTIVAIILIFISVYFWFRKSVHSRFEWVVIVLAAGFSVLFIINMWLIG